VTKLRPLSTEESEALQWWTQLVTEGEVVTQNPKALKNPNGYAHDLAYRLWRKSTILPEVVSEWKAAARGGWLNEPLWPNTPRCRINKVLEAVA
jgi:hypothetical protein